MKTILVYNNNNLADWQRQHTYLRVCVCAYSKAAHWDVAIHSEVFGCTRVRIRKLGRIISQLGKNNSNYENYTHVTYF